MKIYFTLLCEHHPLKNLLLDALIHFDLFPLFLFPFDCSGCVDRFRTAPDEYQKEIPVIVILTEYEGSHYLYQMENELRLSTSTSTGLLANQNMYSSNQLNFTDVVARLISPYLRPDSNLGALSSAVFYQYYTEYLQRHNGITNKQIFDQEAFTITASVSRFCI